MLNQNRYLSEIQANFIKKAIVNAARPIVFEPIQVHGQLRLRNANLPLLVRNCGRIADLLPNGMSTFKPFFSIAQKIEIRTETKTKNKANFET